MEQPVSKKHCLVGQALLNNAEMFPKARASKNMEYSAHMFNCEECKGADGLDF